LRLATLAFGKAVSFFAGLGVTVFFVADDLALGDAGSILSFFFAIVAIALRLLG
jgi:hypothetical protein